MDAMRYTRPSNIIRLFVSKHSRFGPLQGKGHLGLIEMKANSGFYQRRDEVDVAGQEIQFGDDEGGPMQPAELKGLSDRRAARCLRRSPPLQPPSRATSGRR